MYDDAIAPPSMHQLTYQQSEKKMLFSFDIQDGSGAVIYHIDRAEIKADCKCIGHWLRYYVSSASVQRLALKRYATLRPDKKYAFRLRVKDSLGRVSAWSKVIKTAGNQ